MKRALVLLDHGSRRAEAHAHLEALASRVQARAQDTIVRVAHLELAPPGLTEAVAQAVAAGADQVRILPLFLLPGRHVSEDLPRLLGEVRARHPGLDVRASTPLGDQAGLVDLLVAMLEQQRD